jgi:predicted GNAT family N-acyltransferase
MSTNTKGQANAELKASVEGPRAGDRERCSSIPKIAKRLPMMTGFLERLREYDLRLFAPDEISDSTLYSIQRFRSGVYQQFASLPPDDLDPVDAADLEAWHLLARRDEAIVGCIRFVVFAPSVGEDLPTRALANSRCQFDEADQDRCLAALAEYARAWRVAGGAFVQPGGLAVACGARRSGIGTALCLAGVSFMRLVGSVAGVVFAADKTNGAALYAKTGCFPLDTAGRALGLLPDSYHRDRILLMGIAPWTIAPEWEPVIIGLKERLKKQFDRAQWNFQPGNSDAMTKEAACQA